VLNGLWSGETFSFQGKHYQVTDTQMLPKPLQSPRIPIWLAGGWPRRKPLHRAARWDGIYLMTANQETGELLTAEEIREIVAYLKAQRESVDPFDVAVNGETPADARKGAEIVEPYIEAGATWWIEFEDPYQTFEGYRERIRGGPPRR
jgi:alkanesulfonate monooxygenase SsuD/methylene tetrahydromethanopterin reductase-like flavin-dependent oxidoreductase (luciferase family)